MPCCHDAQCRAPPGRLNTPEWRRALWIALAVNVAMFSTEIMAGIAAGSA
jgi:hypothetical protein